MRRLYDVLCMALRHVLLPAESKVTTDALSASTQRAHVVVASSFPGLHELDVDYQAERNVELDIERIGVHATVSEELGNGRTFQYGFECRLGVLATWGAKR